MIVAGPLLQESGRLNSKQLRTSAAAMLCCFTDYHNCIASIKRLIRARVKNHFPGFSYDGDDDYPKISAEAATDHSFTIDGWISWDAMAFHDLQLSPEIMQNFKDKLPINDLSHIPIRNPAFEQSFSSEENQLQRKNLCDRIQPRHKSS